MVSNDAARTLTGKVALARVVEVFAGPLGAFVSGQVLRIDGGGAVLARVTFQISQFNPMHSKP